MQCYLFMIEIFKDDSNIFKDFMSCLCLSSGHQREGVASAAVGGEADPAAGFTLHVHLLS